MEILSSKSSTLSVRGGRIRAWRISRRLTSRNSRLLYTISAFLTISHFVVPDAADGEAVLRHAAIGRITSPFSAKTRSTGPYDHGNLERLFHHDLDEKLRFLLETVVPSNPYVAAAQQAGVASVTPHFHHFDELSLRNTRMYPDVASCDASQADVIGHWPRT